MVTSNRQAAADRRPRTHLVVMVLYDGVQALDVTGPLDVLAAANDHGGRYRIVALSPGGKEVRTTSGLRLAADGRLEEWPGRIGTLMVPGSPNWHVPVEDHGLIGELTRLARSAGRVASLCAGAFPLAAAGLLDGCRVATHWRQADQLAARFPSVHVDRDALFIRDGRIITSAGVTAGIDLTLSLVEEDLGPEVARAAAKDLVVFMARPGGQSQFSVRLRARYCRSAGVRAVLDAVTAAPQADHKLPALAARAGVSVRHLTRLIRQETGTTAARFVEQIRLEAAQSMLESGTDPLDMVARRSGLGSAETLRRAFQRELGITPGAYRARFRSTQPDCPMTSSHPTDPGCRPSDGTPPAGDGETPAASGAAPAMGF
ncbi:GlxA family transcriptional regulator [Streptomyces sp. 142MFCol3.1]|uniref:GlxA family transcriptional regulator n=1 Tax=Streptomyces sp. 142MFCol3.1 TaxID=1172179 RepID=UPI0004155C8C|nr:GlxA family transcriptional regulator [Streptomyces sp. 142MFCol3.1]